MVSTPAFDPNSFVNGISGKDYAELRDNPDGAALSARPWRRLSARLDVQDGGGDRRP
jgi:cell division protein FtsI/penicillin-binding protein 2